MEGDCTLNVSTWYNLVPKRFDLVLVPKVPDLQNQYFWYQCFGTKLAPFLVPKVLSTTHLVQRRKD